LRRDLHVGALCALQRITPSRRGGPMPLTVGTLVERMGDVLELEVTGSPDGLAREISAGEAQSPGLVLTGWTGRFLHHRLQVMGETEISFLASRPADERLRTIELLFSYPIPCLFVTKG